MTTKDAMTMIDTTICTVCPWPMEQTEYRHFCRYLQSKKESICYPFDKFCTVCTNTWFRKGQLCLDHGHKFESSSKDDAGETCLVFFDGHTSCYHGSKKFLIRGDCLETRSGRHVGKGFLATPFGRDA